MHNIFITEHFDWAPRESWKVRSVNRLLGLLGRHARLVPPGNTGEMTNIEQRMNMYHLASQVLAYEVAGDFVELGCFTGQSAVLFQKIIAHYDPSRVLHVYDSFEDDQATGVSNVRAQLVRNFEQVGQALPQIHEGWFQQLLPEELPQQIAFAHIDAGPGLSHDHLAESVQFCLEHLYPRMSRGAIGLLMDYCDPALRESWNLNPAVREASDRFFADKPEKVSVLYAGELSQGYFRKT
jgi:O-methyltransferase